MAQLPKWLTDTDAGFDNMLLKTPEVRVYLPLAK